MLYFCCTDKNSNGNGLADQDENLVSRLLLINVSPMFTIFLCGKLTYELIYMMFL